MAAHNTDPVAISRCRRCGYEAESGSDSWNRIDSPPFTGITQCPDCGSTDVLTGR